MVDRHDTVGKNIGRCTVHSVETVGKHLHYHTILADRHLLTQVLRCVDIKSSGKGRNLDGEPTFLVGHGRIMNVVKCLNLHTSQRLASSSIRHRSFDFHHGIFVFSDGWSLLLDHNSLSSIARNSIILCHGRQARCGSKKNAQAKNMVSFHFHTDLKVRLNRVHGHTCSQDVP